MTRKRFGGVSVKVSPKGDEIALMFDRKIAADILALCQWSPQLQEAAQAITSGMKELEDKA